MSEKKQKMKEDTFRKLRMQNPEYYDNTDNRVALVPLPALEKNIRMSFWRGTRIGSFLGLIGFAVSSLATLITAETFNAFLGLDGPIWHAIFVLIFAVSIGILIVLFFIMKGRGDFNGDTDIQEDFFSDSNKL